MNDIILGQMVCPNCGRLRGMDLSPCICGYNPLAGTVAVGESPIPENKKEIHFYTVPERPEDPAACDIGIFLGGTIEGGSGIDWQKALSKRLNEILPNNVDINVYNPRRPNWNLNTPVVEQLNQIKWEHYYLDRSDIIVMNLLEDSKSPISLMELGMYADCDTLLVFCPKSFYRYENVLCVCEKYDIPLYNTNDVEVIAEKVLERVSLNLL